MLVPTSMKAVSTGVLKIKLIRKAYQINHTLLLDDNSKHRSFLTRRLVDAIEWDVYPYLHTVKR